MQKLKQMGFQNHGRIINFHDDFQNPSGSTMLQKNRYLFDEAQSLEMELKKLIYLNFLNDQKSPNHGLIASFNLTNCRFFPTRIFE